MKPYTKPLIESENEDIVGAVEVVNHAMPTGSPGHQIDTERVYATTALDEERFMRDELEVILAEPSTENEQDFVDVNVNGDRIIALRNGEPVKLKRYHVAVLAQAKQSRIRQKRVNNADGSMGYVEENVLSLTYPFSVMSDPNPKKGAPWLKQILKNPV